MTGQSVRKFEGKNTFGTTLQFTVCCRVLNNYIIHRRTVEVPNKYNTRKMQT